MTFSQLESRLLRPIGDETVENIPELDALEAKPKTIAELIIQSMIDEPHKWVDISGSYPVHKNGTRLYVGDSTTNPYVTLSSESLVRFSREEMNAIYRQIQKMRNADTEKKREDQNKRVMARFLGKS
jgi:hypothetical protein